VTNGGTGDHTVVPIDLTTLAPTPGTPIAVGSAPRGIAMTPDQAPIADFTVSAETRGQASGFDASASSVVFGRVASYTWSFGDGTPDVTTSTPATSHVYASQGAFRVTLTERTGGGTSTNEVFTGQTASRTGAETARAARVAVVAAAPSPVVGARVTAETVAGRVRVKPPGSRRFALLGDGRQLTVGTIVDARDGTVRITATSGGKGYDAVFYSGEFQIAQQRRRGATLDLRLFGGRFAGCPPAARAARSGTPVRRLWGSGKGRFRTVGRFSSAAIRGTTWLTADECRATLTRVTAGAVTVRDLVRRRTVVVRAPRSYVSRARAR
jgi:PKD domain